MSQLITVFVSSPDTYSERKFASSLTVADLKHKLESITGIAPSSQVLSVRNEAGETVASLDNDSHSLQSAGLANGLTLRVDSRSGNTLGDLTDVSHVEKFEMSNEDYAKRDNTLLAFKQRNKLGRFDPARQERQQQYRRETQEAAAELTVGARCEVALSSELSRRGTIRFVGPTSFGPQDGSVWVGIEYDEPVGKNDGSVDGVRYFQTQPQRASFVRPDKVQVGDYPVEDPFADLSDDDDDRMEL